MPGNVVLAVPAVVLPEGLWSAFEESREWVALLTVYPTGEAQGMPYLDIDGDRRRWKLARKLNPADAMTLRQFYLDRKGPMEPFYVYIWLDSPFFSYDFSGTSELGRHTVRFDGTYSERMQLGRTEATLQLVEVL